MTTQRTVVNPLLSPNDDTATRDAKNLGYMYGIAWQPFVLIFRRLEALEQTLEKK
jgi:hypothetical protein